MGVLVMLVITAWLYDFQNTFMFSKFWMWDVWDQGVTGLIRIVIIFIFMCVNNTCVRHSVHGEVRRKISGVGSLLVPHRPQKGTQVTRLVGKCLYLSHGSYFSVGFFFCVGSGYHLPLLILSTVSARCPNLFLSVRQSDWIGSHTWSHFKSASFLKARSPDTVTVWHMGVQTSR